MSFLGSIVSGALSLFGGERQNDANLQVNSANNEFNATQAELNRSFNRSEAEAARNWQRSMSSTEHQRAVADLQAAGLNPMLAVTQGGASTPGGASASGQAASAAPAQRMENSIGHGVNSALHALQLSNIEKQGDVLEAEARKKNAEAMTELNRPENVAADTLAKRGQYGRNETGQRLDISNATRADAETKNLGAQYSYITEQIRNIMQHTKSEEQRTQLLNLQRDLTKAETMYKNGQIGIQLWTEKIEEMESLIRESKVQGAAEDSKFEAASGQFRRWLHTLTPYGSFGKKDN